MLNKQKRHILLLPVLTNVLWLTEEERQPSLGWYSRLCLSTVIPLTKFIPMADSEWGGLGFCGAQTVSNTLATERPYWLKDIKLMQIMGREGKGRHKGPGSGKRWDKERIRGRQTETEQIWCEMLINLSVSQNTSFQWILFASRKQDPRSQRLIHWTYLGVWKVHSGWRITGQKINKLSYFQPFSLTVHRLNRKRLNVCAVQLSWDSPFAWDGALLALQYSDLCPSPSSHSYLP